MLKRGRAVVDADSGLQDEDHQVLDVGGKLYSETMTRADASHGLNSFYIVRQPHWFHAPATSDCSPLPLCACAPACAPQLQIISNDRGTRFHLFRKWGRVGSDSIGGCKLEGPFSSTRTAISAFEEQFEEKTGIPFSVPAEDRVKVPGAFFPIEVRFGETEEGAEEEEGEGEKESALSPAVQQLMRLIFDKKMLQRTMNELEIDLDQLPLGKLSQRTVGLAYQALRELEDVAVDDSDAAGQRLLAQLQGGDVDSLSTRMRKRYTALLDASNRFYSLVPHVTRGGAPLPLLATKSAVADKAKMLDSLAEIEIASSLLRAVRGAKSGSEHPLDACYRALRADIRPVPDASEELDMIRRYVRNTHGATHRQYNLEVLHAFSVDRSGEADRFAPWASLHNQRLLWHGSRVSNVVGILSQGLRIAPPEAPATGYMFGKGERRRGPRSRPPLLPLTLVAPRCLSRRLRVQERELLPRHTRQQCGHPLPVPHRPRRHVSAAVAVARRHGCSLSLHRGLVRYKVGQAEYMEKPPRGYHSTFGMGRTGPECARKPLSPTPCLFRVRVRLPLTHRPRPARTRTLATPWTAPRCHCSRWRGRL